MNRLWFAMTVLSLLVWSLMLVINMVRLLKNEDWSICMTLCSIGWIVTFITILKFHP